MIDTEELAICKRRGHEVATVTPREGWIPCEKCRMWIRDVVTRQEREERPSDEELRTRHLSRSPAIDLIPEELAICRRRGHPAPKVRPGSGWVQCEKCGIWLRAVVTREEREDEPIEEEMDLNEQSRRILKAVKARMDALEAKKEGKTGSGG